MDGKVLRAEASATGHDSYIQLGLSALPDDYCVQCDFYIPDDTRAVIEADSQQFTADFIETDVDGVFGHLPFMSPWDYWSDHTPSSSDGTIVFDTPHTVVMEFHWNSGSPTVTISIDGVTLFGGAYSESVSTTEFFDPTIYVGARFSNWLDGEVYYVDNIKVGTSLGASDILDENFESNSFSTNGWTQVGNVSIVDGPVSAGPNFTLSASPSSLVIAEGTSDTSTISTTASGGDTENIVLFASGLPSDVTVTFDDNTIVAGGSTIAHINVGSSAPAGNYTITINAVGDINTHTRNISLHIAGGNINFGAALPLDALGADGGTLTICKTDVPDTTPSPDYYSIYYGGSPHNQRWYKFTNTKSVPAYFRIDAHCVSKTGGISSNFEFDWGLFMLVSGVPADIETFDPDYDGFLIYDFYIADREADSFTFTNLTTKLSDFSSQGGILLQPGQTVYLDIGFNAFQADVVDGCISLSWTLTGYTTQPITDMRSPDFGGQSIPLPEHHQLDYSGFDFSWPNTDPPQYGFPRPYIYFNGKHYTAALLSLQADSHHTLNTEELGIWELNSDGTQSNFWQIYTFQDHSVSVLVGHDNGERGEGGFMTGKFVTDETDLWFISPDRYARPCPFAPVPTWNPMSLGVYHFNGSSWDLLGFVDAVTSNIMFFGGVFGGNGAFHSYDADARNGVLHCVISEQGTQAGYNTATVFDNDPLFVSGGDQAVWRTAISYATFDSSGKLSQTTPFSTILNTSDMGVLVDRVHDDANIVAIRATPSGPRIFMERTNKYPASSGFQFAFDIFDETGALLKTIDHTLLDPVGANADNPFTPSAMIIGGFSVSKNAFIDPFDGTEVYAIVIVVNVFNSRMTIRFPSDDVTNIKYWLDDPAMSNGGPLGATYQGTTVKPGGDTNNLGLWYPISEVRSIYRWEPCYLQNVQEDPFATHVDGGDGWLTWQHSYPRFGSGYPHVLMLSDDVHWDDVGDNYYFIGQSEDPTGTGVFGTGQSVGLFRTHIRKDFLCHVGDVLISRASIFWFFKDGSWHNAGNDSQYNLFMYKDGQWRSHLSDAQYALHGQLEGSWQT